MASFHHVFSTYFRCTKVVRNTENGIYYIRLGRLLNGYNNEFPVTGSIDYDLGWLDEKLDLSTFNCIEPAEALLNDSSQHINDSASNLDHHWITKFESNFDKNINDVQGQVSSKTFPLVSTFDQSISEPSSPLNYNYEDIQCKSAGIYGSGNKMPVSSPGQNVPSVFCPSPSSSCSSPKEQEILNENPSTNEFLTWLADEINSGRNQLSPEDFCPSPSSSCNESVGTPSELSPSTAELTTIASTEDSRIEMPVSVVVCNVNPDNVSNTDVALSLDDIATSVKKRRFVNKGKEIPKVQVSLKSMFHPYDKTSGAKPRNRNDRKKVQNKEAAARYRIKKRVEQQELSGEVSGLEEKQEELIKKQDELVGEIKYLKKLICEVLKKQGKL
ncbi:hypothetical protein CEXT_184791 [Caerostris extrusa]|uniref:BZIP domain-containing protein n=1 Tax=Caerostris extrusa TaxID=172846 RepID=A0AAV4U375_CAEEX|nr:hypothetical protein CEXT_184791 [Caerostris extrusa]